MSCARSSSGRLFLLGSVLICTSAAAFAAEAGCGALDTDALIDAIRTLTAPELAGRKAGTPEERQAAVLVAGWFSAAGLQPAFSADWFQDVPLPHPHTGTSVNVAGIVPGSGSLAGRWILVGAHLDHLGRVDSGATGVPRPGAYYPGAGDNAAGVAALLHVARAAAAEGLGTGDRRSLLVCAFGAEEIGLLGSAHLAANLPILSDRLDAMLNLDAVGRLGEGPLHVAGAESSPVLTGLVKAAAGDDVRLDFQSALLASSDHASFLAQGIPALFLFTSPYVEMNSPADSLDAVDLPGLARVAALTARLVEALRREPRPLVFSPPVSARSFALDGNRQTWFGTAPDFSGAAAGGETAPGGYRIGGLAAGGPAATAGLLVGDRLVELAGRPVVDLASFTAALRSHAPGDVVEVLVERDGRRLSFLVTLGDRDHRLR